MGAETLVSLVHRHGVAEVRRSDHGAVLTSDRRRAGGMNLESYRAAVAGLPDEVTLSGGLLPPGAVRAVVFDRGGRGIEATCGHGAWIVLLDQPTMGEPPVVRFLDAANELTPVPLPSTVRLEAVTDAIDRCPVCDALEWQKVTAAPDNRYGSDQAGRPTAALCARCGFEEHLGVLYAPAAPPSWPADENIDDTEAEIAEREAEARHVRIDDARSTPFQFYGLTVGSPTYAGLGRSNGVITSITVSHETRSGPIRIQTDTDRWLESPTWLARRAIENLTFEEDWPELSDTAILLWLNARARDRVAEAHRAPVRDVELAINGKSVTFATAALGNSFAAASRFQGATILLSGAGTSDGLELRTISPDDIQGR